MGNCLQGSETDGVDLLRSDNESVSLGGRSASTGSSGSNVNRRSRNHNRETDTGDQRSRSSRSRSGNGNSDQRRQRRASDGAAHQVPTGPPPSYEIASLQRSSASDDNVASSAPIPVYHPSPGVSRQASELTEEEQIKIAQRIGLIQHLPVDIYVEGSKTAKECIICMIEFEDGDRVRFLPCLHTYHVDCIDEWLMRSFSCPSCLEPVDSALLTSYDQQNLAIFTSGSGSIDHGGNSSMGCQTLPQQLEQLTAITSPSSTKQPGSDGGVQEE